MILIYFINTFLASNILSIMGPCQASTNNYTRGNQDLKILRLRSSTATYSPEKMDEVEDAVGLCNESFISEH